MQEMRPKKAERDAWDKACDQVFAADDDAAGADAADAATAHAARVHVKSNSRDTQGRVKKLRAVKWTEGGEDRAQVPFRALLASSTSSNV